MSFEEATEAKSGSAPLGLKPIHGEKTLNVWKYVSCVSSRS